MQGVTMREKILITNLKSRNNIQKAVSEINPDKMLIISSKKPKFIDFEVKTDYIKVKQELESIVHGFEGILNNGDDFSIILKPDKIGVYLLWLAQMHSVNPTYTLSGEELQQISIFPSRKLKQRHVDILKLADCHGFIDPKSINKEFGIPEDEAKEYLEEFSKIGIFEFFQTKEFEPGEEKAHAYYSTDLLEKGKEIEDFYLMTKLGRITLYLTLVGEK